MAALPRPRFEVPATATLREILGVPEYLRAVPAPAKRRRPRRAVRPDPLALERAHRRAECLRAQGYENVRVLTPRGEPPVVAYRVPGQRAS